VQLIKSLRSSDNMTLAPSIQAMTKLNKVHFILHVLPIITPVSGTLIRVNDMRCQVLRAMTIQSVVFWVVLNLFAVTPLASVHLFLIYALSFSV
jgi:hypothetical protein